MADYVAWQADAGRCCRPGALALLAGAAGRAAEPGSADGAAASANRAPCRAGHPFRLGKELSSQVRALAKQENVTFYTVLLAAFYVLLYRYIGQDDLWSARRSLAVRQKATRAPSLFSSPCALRQVRTVLVGAKAHQDFPFSLLVERLGLPRDLSRSPVFQVAFTYQKSQMAHIQGVPPRSSICQACCSSRIRWCSTASNSTSTLLSKKSMAPCARCAGITPICGTRTALPTWPIITRRCWSARCKRRTKCSTGLPCSRCASKRQRRLEYD